MPEEFSEEGKRVIGSFFTNLDSNVFALRNLPEVVKGALFSRYSRSPKGLRRILLDEFINKPEMGFSDIVSFKEEDSQIVATQKAEKFYDRVLIGFGDDSVAELGGAHLAVEGISNIASKFFLEDARIGLSPLEKSTRYVLFNDKVDGKYRYYRDPTIMRSEFADLYVRTCDMLFDVYSELINPLKEHFRKKYPKSPDVTGRAYESTINAKACDTLRNLLPAATLTNVGLFGNGRAFEYLLMKMRTSQLTEIRHLAEKMQHELSKVIPSFVKRVYSKHGDEFVEFAKKTRRDLAEIPVRIEKTEENIPPVDIVYYDSDAVDKVVSFILYEYTGRPLREIMENVRHMPYLEKSDIISAYTRNRENRRHKPGRAFETVYYTFDILADFGAFRDLQRHRILTQARQMLTTDYGYAIPPEIEEAELADDFIVAMEKAKEAFNKIREKYPEEAQYVVPFGYRMRWHFTLNLREAFHLCELRSGRQGHPNYRRIAWQIYEKIKEVHPLLVKHMKFIDMKDYDLERLDAEKRIDRKLEKLKSGG
ncbi:MAG: thymidylate synthase [Candidatus Micrarchaeota archaeon]|nr:thymidylate synthase [Candidatus Micrarchaeota archaeon]